MGGVYELTFDQSKVWRIFGLFSFYIITPKFIMHATISHFFSSIVNMNKVDWKRVCTMNAEILPFVSIMGIFGFGAPFSMKNLLEKCSPVRFPPIRRSTANSGVCKYTPSIRKRRSRKQHHRCWPLTGQKTFFYA